MADPSVTEASMGTGGRQQSELAQALDLPDADPNKGIEEMERRRAVASQVGVSAAGTDDEATVRRALKQRDEFAKLFSGYWVAFVANRDMPLYSDLPAIFPHRYFGGPRAEIESRRYMQELFDDPDVKMIPVRLEANQFYLIPASEAKSQDVQANAAKIARGHARHQAFTMYRAEEFRRRVEAGKREGMDQGTQFDDGVYGIDGSGARAAESAPVVASVFNSTVTARRRQYLEEVKEGRRDRDGVLPPRPPLPGADEELLRKIMAEREAEVAAALQLEARAEAGAGAAPLHTGPLPRHLRKLNARERRHGERTVCDLPAKYANKFVKCNMSVIEDEDRPEDDPKYGARAAGREPMVCLYGGQFKEVADANATYETYMQHWCTGIDVFPVDMDWLFPTEVDRDSIRGTRRTTSEAGSQEMNTIFEAHEKENARARTAQELCGARLPVVELGITDAGRRELPEIDDTVQEDALFFTSAPRALADAPPPSPTHGK